MSKVPRIASDGKPVTLTDTTPDGKPKLSLIAPTMERDIARANTTITVDPCWELVYDANGYCVKCTNIGGKVKVPGTCIAFRNEKADEGWKDCTAMSDDKVIYTLYDGKQNYVAKVNVASGTVELNVGNKNDKELVALMQSYVDAFMEQYK